MPLIKAQSDAKRRLRDSKEMEMYVSEEAQDRLAAILADSPTKEKFAGTEWEMRPLRFGTQYLIVDEVRKIREMESDTYENAVLGLAASIGATVTVVTLALLNDREKIFRDGNPSLGHSALYRRTYDTVMWNSSREDLAKVLWDCIQMVDVSFFMEALGMLRIFRAQVTEKKRTRTRTPARK